MSSPFDDLSFEREIDPAKWTEEVTLHTPTFEALLKADGTLWLSGAALQEGFSVADAQALTRFLSERVQLPPVEPPYDFADWTPASIDLDEEYEATQKRNQAIASYQVEHPFIQDSDESLAECPSCHRQTTKAGLIHLFGNEIKCDACYTLPRLLVDYEAHYGKESEQST